MNFVFFWKRSTIAKQINEHMAQFIYCTGWEFGYEVSYRLTMTAKRRTARANKEDMVVNITIPLDAGK